MSEAGDEVRERMMGFIEAHLTQHGYFPTLRQVGAGVGLSSTNTVDHHLSRLVKEGRLIKRREGTGPTYVHPRARVVIDEGA